MKERQRRSFTDDYKRQAIDLVASSGRSIGSVAEELGLRDSVLRRWVEQRGAGLEPTAASRRPTTQARLPSADHAAEIARREGAVRIEAEEGSEADCRMVISPVAALHVRSVFHGAWLATSTTSYPLGPTQGPRIATIFAGRSPALNEACTTSAGMKAESPGPRMRFSRSSHCSTFPATTSTTSS